MNAITELKALIVAHSAYYGQKLDPTVIQMYAEDLADLPIEVLRRALHEIRRDPKVNRFPLPAVIRARVTPPEMDEDQARDAAARIITAIARCGWTNPDSAKAMIGELGWEVVQRQGGWRSICEGVMEENKTIFQAQWRDLAMSLSRRSRAGTLDQLPALPKPSSAPTQDLQRLAFQMPAKEPA